MLRGVPIPTDTIQFAHAVSTSGLRDPLRFERIFLEKVWGGRALAKTPGFELPPGVAIGETWEVVDRRAENSIVEKGAWEGRSLHELVEQHATDLLGRAPVTTKGRFPLLVKYIDATQDLSVQVHPTDESAARLGPDYEGKTEAWYILDAAPGSVLYAGLKPGVDRATFEREAGGPGVVDLLQRWTVSAGDCVVVPGGTVHAIGAGVTLLEVQQNSDTTFRIYDWGRVGLDGQPRETHLEQALAVVDFDLPELGPVQAVWDAKGGSARAPLARSRYFGINALRFEAETGLGTDHQFQIYAVLEGRGRLRMRGSESSEEVAAGDVRLIPAAGGDHSFEPIEDETRPHENGTRASLKVLQLLALP